MMKMRILAPWLWAMVILLLVVPGFLAAPMDALAEPISTWPMFRHNALHTGSSSLSGPTLPRQAWRVYLFQEVEGWPYSTREGDWVYSSPAVDAEGTVYIGSFDGQLYAVDPGGAVRWHFRTGLYVESSPAVGPDGTIYVGSHDGKLHALSPTGEERWVFPTGSYIESSPTVGPDGTIYVGSDDGILYALTPTGGLLWSYQAGSSLQSSPALAADGTVYVGCYDGSLYAFTPTGELKWRYRTGLWVTSSPAVGSDGTVYVGSWDHSLYAFTPTGELKWRYQTGDSISSSPAVAPDGTIYVGSWDGALYALHPDGGLRWKVQTSGWVRSSPAVDAQGMVYVGSWDHCLYAVTPAGEIAWRFPTGGWVRSSPALGPDGTIYVGANDGFLYAIHSPESLPTAVFSDTPSTYWAYPETMVLVQQGLLQGYPDGSLRPESSLTRAEFCKLLATALSLTPTLPAQPTFPDVPSEHWAFSQIEVMTAMGYLRGDPDSFFRPEGSITLAEVLTVLVRVAGWSPEDLPVPPPSFQVRISAETVRPLVQDDWYASAVGASLAHDLLRTPDLEVFTFPGKETGEYELPLPAPASRGMVFVLLARTLGIAP